MYDKSQMGLKCILHYSTTPLVTKLLDSLKIEVIFFVFLLSAISSQSLKVSYIVEVQFCKIIIINRFLLLGVWFSKMA